MPVSGPYFLSDQLLHYSIFYLITIFDQIVINQNQMNFPTFLFNFDSYLIIPILKNDFS